MSHKIYYTFYLQGGETDYHVHRESTRISGDILVFLIAHTCVPYINGIAEISASCTGIQQMNRADCAFLCTGVIYLLLESKSIGIHEIPVPQNQIHSVRQTSQVYAVVKQFHKIKYHRNLLPMKIILLFRNLQNFIHSKIFTYMVYAHTE